MTQREATAWALYVSELWYTLWTLPRFVPPSRRLYGKARGVVLFDRCLVVAEKEGAK